MYDGVLDLIKLFASQGHSGMSAGITSGMFSELSKFRTLSPNDHSEYIDVSAISGRPLLQCSRDSRYFSDDDGSTWYNVDDKKDKTDADG